MLLNSILAVSYFSKSISISGVARDKTSKGLSNSSIAVISKGKNSQKIYYVETKIDGRFFIDNINQTDSLNLDFAAYDKNGKPIDLIVCDKS